MFATILLLTNCKHKNEDVVFQYIDQSVRPQDDLYHFVNGTWLKNVEIPSDQISVGVAEDLEMKSGTSLYAIIDQILSENHPKGSNEQFVKDYYLNFLDIKTRNGLGLKPLDKYFNQIDQISNIQELQQYFIDTTPVGLNPFYTFSIEPDLKNSDRYVVNLREANLTLQKNYYQIKDEHNQQIINALEKYITNILPYISNKSKHFNANDIITFENKIAQYLNTTEQDLQPEQNNNVIQIQDVQSLSKSIDFKKYIESFGLKVDNVVIGPIDYFKNMDQFITPNNLAFLKDYLKYKLISDFSKYATSELRTNYFELFDRAINGQETEADTETLAMTSTNENFGEIIGQYYVKESFSSEDKQKATELVHTILDAYKIRLQHLDWMSKQTKNKALEKLSKMKLKVGYPDKWEDLSGLTIKSKKEGGNLIGNLEEISKWNFNKLIKAFHQPVDKQLWNGTTPHEVNAYYEPSTNTIILPAGILQAPFFDKNADAAINFGFIGAIIGHEITHGFDNLGAKFDGNGNLVNWWQKADEVKFSALIDQLKNQFNAYEPFKGIFVNGELTSSENIADLGGVAIAFEAFNQYIKKHGGNEKINGFSSQERFFMAYAASWRSKETKEALINQLKTDTHSPSYYRVIGIVRNLDSFHEVFKTKPGDKLYQPPQKRIRIW